MIIYAGYGEIGIQGLQIIFSEHNYSPSEIYVLIDEDNGDLLIKNYCKKYNLQTIDEEKLKVNSNLFFDICISVHWRKKIQRNIINICKYGGVNLHPSLLPKYAGCSSLAWAIIKNEDTVGFTWHKITENFDEGDILLQSEIKVSNKDTAFSLWNKVNKEGILKIIDVLEIIKSNNYNSIKQDLRNRTYFGRGFPSFEEALKINKDLDKNTYLRASFFPSKKSKN